ncbi:MAG: DUF460 domain-containing protein [Desulfurococcales archaeon]|nr:DUF460 domain-containing protein [Desulfurococcales archaeon]
MSSRWKAVVGVDIIRSGGTDLNQYYYAIAVLQDGRVRKTEEGSLGHLIRLLWEYRPALLAVDNIYELGGTKENLRRILRFIPPETEIVQVTLEDSRFHDLKEVAFKAGLLIDKGKLHPFKTAALLAILANEGYGTRLSLFERKVKIIVSKGRSGYAGGSRSDKYQRNMRAAVMRMVKRIKEELDKKRIDYDLMIRRSKGGVERALFIVYADRRDLTGIVRNIKGYDVAVRIKPVINARFFKLIESKRPEQKYLIVGYDPGVVAGLAAIDLDMSPVLIISGRELDRGTAVSLLTDVGIPVVIATDKNPPPDMVKKLAAMVNAQLFTPPKSLSTGEKELLVNEYTKKFDVEVRNTHERDALAAALKAYSIFREKMEKLSAKVRSIGIKVRNLQKYKIKLLHNEPLENIIEDIINDVLSASRRNELSARSAHSILVRDKQLEQSNLEEKIKELESKVEHLTAEREKLRQRIRELENEYNYLKSELNIISTELSKDILKERKVSELIQRLKNVNAYALKLEKDLVSLKQNLSTIIQMIEGYFRGDYVLVRRISSSPAGIKDSTEYLGKIRKYEVIFLDVTQGNQGLLATYLKDFVNLCISLGLRIALPKNKVSDQLASALVNTYYIPALTVQDYYFIGSKLTLLPKHVVTELDTIHERLKKLREEQAPKLTEEALEKLVAEYREKRTALLSKKTTSHKISKN